MFRIMWEQSNHIVLDAGARLRALASLRYIVHDAVTCFEAYPTGDPTHHTIFDIVERNPDAHGGTDIIITISGDYTPQRAEASRAIGDVIRVQADERLAELCEAPGLTWSLVLKWDIFYYGDSSEIPKSSHLELPDDHEEDIEEPESQIRRF